MKRNDIVLPIDNKGWAFYGRVNRVLPDGQFEVIDCGKHITIYREDELKVCNDYKGYIDGYQHGAMSIRRKFPVWRRMPSLRKLKQRAAWYNKKAWKKHR